MHLYRYAYACIFENHMQYFCENDFEISFIFKNVPSQVIVHPTFIPSVGVN